MNSKYKEKNSLLFVPVKNLVMADAIDCIMSELNDGPPTFVAFVNANSVNLAYKNAEYLQILQNADYVFADGIGMRLAGRWLGQPLRDNVNGTDLFPLLCERLRSTPHRVFLLGGRPGVAEKVKDWIDC